MLCYALTLKNWRKMHTCSNEVLDHRQTSKKRGQRFKVVGSTKHPGLNIYSSKTCIPAHLYHQPDKYLATPLISLIKLLISWDCFWILTEKKEIFAEGAQCCIAIKRSNAILSTPSVDHVHVFCIMFMHIFFFLLPLHGWPMAYAD